MSLFSDLERSDFTLIGSEQYDRAPGWDTERANTAWATGDSAQADESARPVQDGNAAVFAADHDPWRLG